MALLSVDMQDVKVGEYRPYAESTSQELLSSSQSEAETEWFLDPDKCIFPGGVNSSYVPSDSWCPDPNGDDEVPNCPSSASPERKIGGIVGATLAVVALIIMVVVFAHKRVQEHARLQPHDFQSEMDGLRATIHSQAEQIRKGAVSRQLSEEGVLATAVPREIKRNDITKSKKIGQGQFGEVFSGVSYYFVLSLLPPLSPFLRRFASALSRALGVARSC